MSDHFIVKIDQLPEERIEAADVREAARKVTEIIAERPELKQMHDDEPVQIKRPDRTPWGRHLTLADFRRGDVTAEGDDDAGPQRPASPSAYLDR